jgi:hypothetical protein
LITVLLMEDWLSGKSSIIIIFWPCQALTISIFLLKFLIKELTTCLGWKLENQFQVSIHKKIFLFFIFPLWKFVLLNDIFIEFFRISKRCDTWIANIRRRVDDLLLQKYIFWMNFLFNFYGWIVCLIDIDIFW